MRDLALALALLTGCSSTAVIEAAPSAGGGAGDGSGGGSAGGGGNSVTQGSSGVGGGLGGFGSGGSGAGKVVWDNDCVSTGVTLQIGSDPPIVLGEPCDSYGAMHHDGPVAYQEFGGAYFQAEPTFYACDGQSGRRLELDIVDQPGDPDPIVSGYYEVGNLTQWVVEGGRLTQTGGAGEIGQVIEGSFTLSVGGNPWASGTLRVCRIPDLYLP